MFYRFKYYFDSDWVTIDFNKTFPNVANLCSQLCSICKCYAWISSHIIIFLILRGLKQSIVYRICVHLYMIKLYIVKEITSIKNGLVYLH